MVEDRVSKKEPDDNSEGFRSEDLSEELSENDTEVSAGEWEQLFIDLRSDDCYLVLIDVSQPGVGVALEIVAEIIIPDRISWCAAIL